MWNQFPSRTFDICWFENGPWFENYRYLFNYSISLYLRDILYYTILNYTDSATFLLNCLCEWIIQISCEFLRNSIKNCLIVSIFVFILWHQSKCKILAIFKAATEIFVLFPTRANETKKYLCLLIKAQFASIWINKMCDEPNERFVVLLKSAKLSASFPVYSE